MSYCSDTVIADDLRTKRQQILDAAYDVFSRKGYHRATVDEIIALADTGKGTVYNYFTNKEQLFYTVIYERSEPFERTLAQVVESAEPPLFKIEAMIKLFLQFYITNGDLWRVMMHEMRGLGGEGLSKLTEAQRNKYHEFLKRPLAMIVQVLYSGIEQGALKDCDVNKAAYGLFSVIVMMVFQKFVSDDIDITAQGIADIFFYGVAQR